MTVEKNTITLILIFVCGILAGVVGTGLLTPQQLHPAQQVVFTDKAPQPIGPYS